MTKSKYDVVDYGMLSLSNIMRWREFTGDELEEIIRGLIWSSQKNFSMKHGLTLYLEIQKELLYRENNNAG